MKWHILSIFVCGKKTYSFSLVLKFSTSNLIQKVVFLLVPNPIVFKRDGAQLLLCFPKTRLQLFFVGKEERQNSNYVVEVSQKCQKSGRAFVKSRQGGVQLIVFCGKVKAPTFFWASYFSQKCHRRGVCQRRTEMLSTYCYLWEMRGTKSLEFLVAVFQFL